MNNVEESFIALVNDSKEKLGHLWQVLLLRFRTIDKHVKDEFVQHLEDLHSLSICIFLTDGRLLINTVQVLLYHLSRSLEERRAEDLLFSQE